MKKVCFIVSHLGSGSIDLINILNQNPRCLVNNTRIEYSSVDSLNWLFFQDHKCRDNSAIYGDHILYNVSFSCKKLYEFCKFIYVIRPARASLNDIKNKKDPIYEDVYASRYYKFRLRRIYEMAKRTPGAVFVTWDDLAKGVAFPIIEEYLGLKQKLKSQEDSFSLDNKDVFKENLIEECEDAYQRYYFNISKLNLRRADRD